MQHASSLSLDFDINSRTDSADHIGNLVCAGYSVELVSTGPHLSCEAMP